MRHVAVTLLCMALLGSPATVVNAQSLYGPGGLFLHPTADVPEKGQVTVGVIALPQHIHPTAGLHTNPTWISGTVDYGLNDNIEVGFTSLGITHFDPSFGGYFKYRFRRESSRMPAMAVGFTFSGFGECDGRAGFLALRKQLSTNDRHPIVGHVGLQYINVLGGLPYNQFLPHAGVEVGVARRLTFIAEARPRGKGDIKTSTALSLSYQYGKGNRLVVTWANTGQSVQPRFGVGVGYLIGTRR
jgi:hypothetical protein